MHHRLLDSFSFLEGEILVLQKNRDRRQNTFLGNTNEVGSEIERQQVVRKPRRDDRFQILEFDVWRSENLGHQFETIKLVIIACRSVSECVPAVCTRPDAGNAVTLISAV